MAGATFSSLFAGWPKDRLATVHNDSDPQNWRHLQHIITGWVRMNSTLSSRSAGCVVVVRSLTEGTAVIDRAAMTAQPTASPRSSMIERVRQRVLQDSIPERARLTPEMHRWIADFRPEVIYTILGSNGMMALIEQIRTTFGLQLVVHIMDDWSMSAHRKGLFAPLERAKMNRWLAHFFKVADTCVGISPAMQNAYSKRYHRPFTAIQFHARHRALWRPLPNAISQPRSRPNFLYVGSIFADAQLRSLIDCTRAIAELNSEGFLRRAFASSRKTAILPAYGHLLATHPAIALEPSRFGDAEFFAMLSRADALLLPCEFRRPTARH